MLLDKLLRLASLGLDMEVYAGGQPASNQQANFNQQPQVQPLNNQHKPLDLSLAKEATHLVQEPANLVKHRNKQQQQQAAVAAAKLLANSADKLFKHIRKPPQQAASLATSSSSVSPASSSCSVSSGATGSDHLHNLHHGEKPLVSSSASTQATGNANRRPSQKLKGAKSHLCVHCGRLFSRSDMLTRHSRLHSGLKPYQCGKCKQVFSRSDHLSTHERTHTGEKPYQCQFCIYSACRRDMITRHMRIHGVKPPGLARQQPEVGSPGQPERDAEDSCSMEFAPGPDFQHSSATSASGLKR